MTGAPYFMLSSPWRARAAALLRAPGSGAAGCRCETKPPAKCGKAERVSGEWGLLPGYGTTHRHL